MGFFVLADVIRDELQQRLLLPALFAALDYKRDRGGSGCEFIVLCPLISLIWGPSTERFNVHRNRKAY